MDDEDSEPMSIIPYPENSNYQPDEINGHQSFEDVSIINLAAIADCLDEVDSIVEVETMNTVSEYPSNPYRDSNTKRQVYLDRLWEIYIKLFSHLEKKQSELNEMMTETMDEELTQKEKHIFLLLKDQMEKLTSSYNRIEQTIIETDPDDVTALSKSIASLQNDVKSIEAYIHCGLETLEESSNISPQARQKSKELLDKLNCKHREHKFNICKLNQKLTDIDYTQYGLDDNEQSELANDLADFSESLSRLAESLNVEAENRELAMGLTKEIGEKYEIFINFEKFSQQLKTEIETLENKLDKITGRYEITPEAMLSRRIRAVSKAKQMELGERNGLKIFKLPFTETHKEPQDKLRSYELGYPKLDKDHRYILLTGMTGAGKSLLVNNMINYVYGISHHDQFRFKLVEETEEIKEREKGQGSSQAESMTSWVTSYTLHWQDGFRIPYSLTIVDTPGFGDTRGLDFDEQIITQLRKFFHNMDMCPTQELSCIGLLIQSSQARITDEQKYIFDQVLNIFGKDMSNNIFLIFTFADAEEPPALEVVKVNKIPFAEGCTFKFNNSAVYARNNDNLSKNAWDFGYLSLERYFNALTQTKPISLSLTKQVLNEREKLRLILGALQAKISDGMEILKQIEDQSQFILRLNGTIKANRNFKVKKKVCNCVLKVVTHPITNCSKCNFTCHSPCAIAGDVKNGCAAMGSNGQCEICPSKCSFEVHTNGTNIYVYNQVEVDETVEDMLKEYNVAVGDKDAKKQLLQNMLSRYQVQKAEVFDSIHNANEYSNRLEEIALRNSFLNNVEYIERLIQSEERSSRPNKANRLKQFRHMKDMAEILRDARSDPEHLTGRVSAYEAEINTIIDRLEVNEQDENTDTSAGFESDRTGKKVRSSAGKMFHDTKKWFGKAFTSYK